LSLEGVAALTAHCHYLHTLHAVVNATGASDAVLASRFVSSKALLRLHFGHSWIKDPLQTTICLSHIAPYLESLKWFHEKNRPGFIEAHAQGWQQASDFLPHLQKLRLMERDAVVEEMAQHYMYAPQSQAPEPAELRLPIVETEPQPEEEPEVIPAREYAEKAVDATPIMVHEEVFAEPETFNEGVQASPACVEEAVQAEVLMESVSIQAEAPYESVSVQAEPTLQSTYVDATLVFSDKEDKESQCSPTLTHRSLDPESPTLPKAVLPMADDAIVDKLGDAQTENTSDAPASSETGDVQHHPRYLPIPSIASIFALMRELFVAPPLLLSLWLMSRSLGAVGARHVHTEQEVMHTPTEQEIMHVPEEDEKEFRQNDHPAPNGHVKDATDATMVTASEEVSPVCL
jgi:hypothetical protein